MSPGRSPPRAPPSADRASESARLGKSKSSGTLARMPAGPASTTPVRPSPASQRQLAVQRSTSPVAAAAQQQSMQLMKKQLEETRKEVREIRAIESKMRWDMQREEKLDVMLEQKANEDEVRDWRWQQSDEMKAYIAEKEAATRATELQESKTYQEFKREHKLTEKEREQQYIHEMYLQDVENASWRAELSKAMYEKEKEIVADRLSDVQHLRDYKADHKLMEKAQEEEERAIEQNLEMASLAQQLAKEKEELLQSLQYARQCTKKPLAGGRGLGGAASARRPR